MKFDDFLAAIDRTSPVPVAQQVASLLSLLDDDTITRYSYAVAAMPSDVSDAFGEWVHARLQNALGRKRSASGRKPAGERRQHVTVTLPESLVERIPYPRSAFVERALLALLDTLP